MKSTERYEILDELGRGGMGVVYRAYDRRRKEEVAIKTLPGTEPDDIFQFKQEFRALSGVVHPNLVVLHELEQIDGVWSISMELIRGVDFIEHVWPGRASVPSVSSTKAMLSPRYPTTTSLEPAGGRLQPDLAAPRPPAEPLAPGGEARLRAALNQLARGIHALHTVGKLHCDIKPSNVLVTAEGRVVVLDFGLVTELVPSPFDRYRQREIAGTALYIAPEQIQRMPLTPAADWYAFGVLLYDALTGRLPFEGDVSTVLRAKLAEDPLPPRAIAPNAPGDLCDLCVELLRRSPAERPEAPEIFAWLGASPTRSRKLRSTFVGRAKEFAELEAMFEAVRRGRAVTVFVHGASGIGKSTLVRRFLERLDRREPFLVFEGRCYEHESVPYKALDSIIDHLSQYLVRLPPQEAAALLPDEAHLLGQAFPVLKRVRAIADNPLSLVRGPDQQELRRRVFAALRELFRRLASRTPLALLIDDAQWGDADSATLLLEIFSPPSPPPLLLIACCRTEDLATSPPLKLLLERWASPLAGHDVHRIELGALSTGETRELTQSLLGDVAADLPELADAIISEADGSPLFAQELARHALFTGGARDLAAPSIVLEDVFRERVALLSVEERRLLELLSIAGHPVQEEAAARAAETAPFERRALARLQALHLVSRRGPDPAGPLEPYHDRIRKAVVAGLGPDAANAYHLALAQALEALPDVDPEILAEHYRQGGALARAAQHSIVAAERASGALAFSRAASLYRSALDSGVNLEERWRIRTKMAEALANSGKGKDAAASFADAARELESWMPRDLSALDLRRRAAEHYLRSGHIDEGLALLRQVLAEAGARYPRTPTGALVSLVHQRTRLRVRGLGFQLRDPAQISPEDRLKVEAYWSAGLGLSMVDSVRAAYFQTRHELLALELGEPVNVARGLSSHVAALGSEGGAANRRRCDEVLEAAESLGRKIDDPSILMLTHLCAGTAAYFGGQWRRAVERLRAAQKIGRERCVGVTWEMNSAELFELWALAYLGDLPELSLRLPRLLKEAHERDDVFAETGLLLGLPNMVWLARDRPDEADEHVAAAMRRWTSAGFYSQHYFALVARAQTALYRGNGTVALRLLEAAWPKLERAMLLRLQSIRIELHHLRARAALSASAALNSSQERRKLLHLAVKDGSSIAGEDMPWALPLAEIIEAGVFAQRGERKAAKNALGRAAEGFDSLEMGLYAAAVRFQRERLTGGAGDGTWMVKQGIVDPSKMASMLVPGCERAP